MYERPLTARQRAVLRMAGEGKSNREIAKELGLSENAVRFHLKQLHAELETDGDRLRLRMRAWQRFRMWAASFTLLKPGQTVVAAIAVVAMSGVGLAGVIVGHTWRSDDESRPSAVVTIRTWEGVTVEELGGHDADRIAEIRLLNPGLPAGPLPAEMDVRVPQPGEGPRERQQIFPTPSP